MGKGGRDRQALAILLYNKFYRFYGYSTCFASPTSECALCNGNNRVPIQEDEKAVIDANIYVPMLQVLADQHGYACSASPIPMGTFCGAFDHNNRTVLKMQKLSMDTEVAVTRTGDGNNDTHRPQNGKRHQHGRARHAGPGKHPDRPQRGQNHNTEKRRLQQRQPLMVYW